MNKIIRKVFGLYPGEYKNAFLFSLLALVWSCGISIAETLGISLFIEKIGAGKLPYIYLFSGLVMVGCSSLFLYLLRITTPGKIFIGILSSAFITFTASAIYLSVLSPEPWFWYTLEILITVFVAACIACFWTLVDQHHDLQEAKRIYGIYNASFFLGFTIAGFLINIGMDRLGSVGLFSIGSVCLILAIILTKVIIKKIASIEDDMMEDLFSGGKKSLGSIFKLFFSSPFAVSLVAMSLLIQLLRTTTEFGCMDTFSRTFQSENAIAEFLGKCRGFIGAANIIIGMFFYRRFIRRIGLTNMILVPPILFCGIYSKWMFYNSLLVAVLALIAAEGILDTLEDNNFNLLINAAPSKLKGALRIINDSFFEHIGILLGALFLLLMQKHYVVMGLTLSALFLTASFWIRFIYPKSIFISLRQNAIHFERKISSWLQKLGRKEQKEIKKDLLSALYCQREPNCYLACKPLLDLKSLPILQKILNVGNDFSSEGKIILLGQLEQSSFAGHPQVIKTIDGWIQNSGWPDLEKLCQLFLAKRGLLHPEKVIDDLDHPDLYIRASAIITLKKSLANQNLEKGAFYQTIATKELDLLLKSENEDEICMGLDILHENIGTDSFEKALSFFEEESSIKVLRKASAALSKIADKKASRHAFGIIEALEDSSDSIFRGNCLEALGKIGDSSTVAGIIRASIFFRPSERRLTEKIIANMGLKIVPLLISFIKDVKEHERSRILAGKLLSQLSLPQLQANLKEIIAGEIKRAYFYFYYAHTVQSQYPLLDLKLLVDALISGFNAVRDFIIHLLGAAGSIEDCDLVVHALRSAGSNAKAHSHAIETLEKHCDLHIFRQILPLIDDIPWEEKLESSIQINGRLPKLSLGELLNTMENSPLLFDKTVAISLKAKLQMPDWEKSLKEQMKTGGKHFHHFAYELLET